MKKQEQELEQELEQEQHELEKEQEKEQEQEHLFCKFVPSIVESAAEPLKVLAKQIIDNLLVWSKFVKYLPIHSCQNQFHCKGP